MKDTVPLSCSSCCVSSDSSFYIGFADELKKKEWLLFFLKNYQFYLGKRLLGELTKSLALDPQFIKSVYHIEVDYYELVKPYFGRNPKHMDDGEYEAIGIAHYLYLKGILHCLIIDEKRTRNFVDQHFHYLMDKLVGGIGFIRNCCERDKTINRTTAIDILTTIKKSIDGGKRVFGIDKNTYEAIVAPIVKTLSASCEK